MKTALSLALSPAVLLLCSVLPATFAQEKEPPAQTGNIQVQTTVFKVTGPELPLSLLNEPLASDEALFARLAGMVSDGSAELTADQHSTIPSSKEGDRGQLFESLKETPFPTEYTPQRGGLELVPQSFEFRACGLTMGAQFKFLSRNPGQPVSAGVLGPLSVEITRGDQIRSWPVSLPSAPADGSLDAPQFLTEKTQLIFKSSDGLHHLISVVRRAGETLEKNDEYCLTFAKAAPESGKSAPPAARSTALRLHALTFRLPTAEGRHLLDLRQQNGGGDRALLDSLLQASAARTAELCEHSVLRVDYAEVNPVAGRDPFSAADGNPDFVKVLGVAPEKNEPKPQPASANLNAIEEFMFPTEHSQYLSPQSFEFKNIGRTFEVVAGKRAGSGLTPLRIGLEEYQAPELFSWPEKKDGEPRGTQVHYPAFSVNKLSARLSVRPGGIYCLGAIVLPPLYKDQQPERSMIQISLLKVIGDTVAAITTSAPEAQPELSSEIFSLSPGDAAKLKILRDSPAEAEALLARLTQEGTAHSLAYFQIAGAAASCPEIFAGVETPIPLGSLRTNARFLLATNFEIYSQGNSLRFSPENEPGKGKLQMSLDHGNATLIQPTTAELEKAADSDGDGILPQPERFVNETRLPFAPRPFQILSLAPAKVPAGHPEEGRWQAAVLRCQNQ